MSLSYFRLHFIFISPMIAPTAFFIDAFHFPHCLFFFPSFFLILHAEPSFLSHSSSSFSSSLTLFSLRQALLHFPLLHIDARAREAISFHATVHFRFEFPSSPAADNASSPAAFRFADYSLFSSRLPIFRCIFFHYFSAYYFFFHYFQSSMLLFRRALRLFLQSFFSSFGWFRADIFFCSSPLPACLPFRVIFFIIAADFDMMVFDIPLFRIFICHYAASLSFHFHIILFRDYFPFIIYILHHTFSSHYFILRSLLPFSGFSFLSLSHS